MENTPEIITIYVSRISGTNKIKLRDSQGNNPGNTDIATLVKTGDTVEWKLDTDSGLDAIIGVKKKLFSRQLLKEKPTDKNGVWKGTVKDISPGKGKKESYKIGYTLPDTEKEYWDDPKLIMNN